MSKHTTNSLLILFVTFVLTSRQTNSFSASNIYKNNILNGNVSSETFYEPLPLPSSGTLENTELNEPNYYTQTYFSMYKYFKNLYTYMPSNSGLSCSFVSLISVLSYFDTFYNDDIIGEIYDRHDPNITTLSQAYLVSPGVVRSGESFTSPYYWYTYCHNTMNSNFTSKLTVIYNQIKGTDDTVHFVEMINLMSEMDDIVNAYLGTNQCTFYLNYSENQNNYFSIIRNYINSGFPVIVGISDALNNYPHEVVAYDFDDNYVYANYGWGSSDTHIALPTASEPTTYYNFNHIRHIAVVSFTNMGHSHSNNYVINNVGYCGCNPNNLN